MDWFHWFFSAAWASTSIGSVTVCHSLGSACQVSTIAPPSLVSSVGLCPGCVLGLHLAHPAFISSLAPSTVIVILVSLLSVKSMSYLLFVTVTSIYYNDKQTAFQKLCSSLPSFLNGIHTRCVLFLWECSMLKHPLRGLLGDHCEWLLLRTLWSHRALFEEGSSFKFFMTGFLPYYYTSNMKL